VPPLFRLQQGSRSAYARDEKHKEDLLRKEFSGRGKVEISRFKGLGEMMPQQLKETTMDPKNRTLLQVQLLGDDRDITSQIVEQLMGNKPEERFRFISERAQFVTEDVLDI
jgi:topoisomerase-4 subunit B